MPIRFHCETCRRSLCVPDGSEGKKTRCPECYSIVRIPFSGNVALQTVESPQDTIEETEDPLGITGKNESRWDIPEPEPPSANPFADPPAGQTGPQALKPSSDQPSDLARKQQALKTIATILIVFAVFMLVGTLLWVITRIMVFADNPTGDPRSLGSLAGVVTIFVVQMVTIVALNEARKMGNYTTARTGMILAIIPLSNPAACLIVPLGLAIWGMSILADAEVRDAFGK